MRAMTQRTDAALIAPGATAPERALGYGVGLAGAVFAVLAGKFAGLPAVALVVLGAVGFDMFGGAVVNAMDSAKQWWHRPGRTARHQVSFVAAHVHPFLLAWAIPDFGWSIAFAIYVTALASAALVVSTPPRLQRPVGYTLAVFGTSAILVTGALPAAVCWFVPVLLIKLLLAHLQPEAAPRSEPGSAAHWSPPELGVTPVPSDRFPRGVART